MAQYISDRTAGLLKVAAFVGGAIVGGMYGGAVGSLLLSTALPASIEALNIHNASGLKKRWQIFLDAINPWGNQLSKSGKGYQVLSMLGSVATLFSLTAGLSYFAPIVAPYIANYITTSLQPYAKAAVDIVCTNVAASTVGNMIDQQDSNWVDYVIEKKAEETKGRAS